MIHKRIRVYMLVPVPNSIKNGIDMAEVRHNFEERVSHVLTHPIFGQRAREFVEVDFSRLFRDPPQPPDLPEGFTKDLIDAHNWAVKRLYRFYKPAVEYSFMVRVPAEDEVVSVVDTEIKNFMESVNNSGLEVSFNSAVRLVSKIVELGLVSGIEIWPSDVIDDLRTLFIGAGLDPRELEEYYSFKRVNP